MFGVRNLDNASNCVVIQGAMAHNTETDIAGVTFANYDDDDHHTYNMASLGTRDHFGTSLSNGYGDLVFRTNNGQNNLIERMRLLFNGNFGIGTSNPEYKLDVNGTINALKYENLPIIDTSNLPLYVSSNQTSFFATNSQEYNLLMSLESSNTLSGTFKIQCSYDYISKATEKNELYVSLSMSNENNGQLWEKKFTKNDYDSIRSDLFVQHISLSNPTTLFLSAKTSHSNDFIIIKNASISLQKVLF